MLPDCLGETFFDDDSDLGCGKGQAVVTIDGALDAACPGKGLVGTEKYGADLQQTGCNRLLP